GPTIYLAKSSVAIDDGAWHTVTCDLRDGKLSITVDGTLRGEHAVPKTVSVSNSDEVRIGGKGTSPNNDQFNGELDDIWITVGP
ncbi:MAG TPA: LamG-like jellyroll fold domain-containing protein, partial [Micromonosporaceae bacterium]